MTTINCLDGPYAGLRYNVLGEADEIENVHGEAYQVVQPGGGYRHVGQTTWERPPRVKVNCGRNRPAWAETRKAGAA